MCKQSTSSSICSSGLSSSCGTVWCRTWRVKGDHNPPSGMLRVQGVPAVQRAACHGAHRFPHRAQDEAASLWFAWRHQAQWQSRCSEEQHEAGEREGERGEARCYPARGLLCSRWGYVAAVATMMLLSSLLWWWWRWCWCWNCCPSFCFPSCFVFVVVVVDVVVVVVVVVVI